MYIFIFYAGRGGGRQIESLPPGAEIPRYATACCIVSRESLSFDFYILGSLLSLYIMFVSIHKYSTIYYYKLHVNLYTRLGKK